MVYVFLLSDRLSFTLMETSDKITALYTIKLGFWAEHEQIHAYGSELYDNGYLLEFNILSN
jgi:hypothetical protein